MSRLVMKVSFEKGSGASTLQPDVQTSVTNLLGRVLMTAFPRFSTVGQIGVMHPRVPYTQVSD